MSRPTVSEGFEHGSFGARVHRSYHSPSQAAGRMTASVGARGMTGCGWDGKNKCVEISPKQLL